MILHLVRHPPPDIASGVCYGQLDIPALEIEATAARLHALLPSDLPVWSSPLQRCKALAEHLHPTPRCDARLMEMSFGAWEGVPWDEIARIDLDDWAADVAGYRPPSGESGLDLQRRLLPWLAERTEREFVLVAHAGTLRALVAHVRNLEPARWLELQFHYGSLTTIQMPESWSGQ